MRTSLGLEETWRWYGPNDPVSLSDVRQAGATGIVTALHEVPTGEVWSVTAIQERKKMIEDAGLTWSVVESIPVHESIKYGGAQRDKYIEAYKQSIRNLRTCKIDTVCYNFMPVVDWTRTNLDFGWDDGSKALRFDRLSFAAFELHILKRPGAEETYTKDQKAQILQHFNGMSDTEKTSLTENIVAGMPGRMVEAYSMEEFQAALDCYIGLTEVQVKANLKYFLSNIVPVAEEEGVYLAIHPDDPPVTLFGLPRVVSTQQDLRDVLEMYPSVHNGLTICVGTMASRPDNDIPSIVEEFSQRIHFIHLRNVVKDMDTAFFCSFTEADHLTGDVDMFHVLTVMLKEQRRRLGEGKSNNGPSRLPFRPDHGHQMLDDLDGDKKTNPGYTGIGRLRGLAELRGLQLGVLQSGVLDR